MCDEYDFDELMEEIADDIVGYGDTFIFKGNKEKFEQCNRILPSQIMSVDTEMEEDGVSAKLKTLHLKGNVDVSGDQVVWLSYNHVGEDFLGFGVLKALLIKYSAGGMTRPPFAVIKAKIQKSMMDQIEQFGSYNEMWVLPKIPDSQVPVYNARIQQMKKGQRLTTNAEGAQVVQSIPERMRGLDFYAQILWDSFYLGLGSAYPKLILGGGSFTEASANVATSISGLLNISLQRFLKGAFEKEFFNKWLTEAGLDPVKARVRMYWKKLQMPDMSVLMSVLTKFVELQTITNPEMRKVFIEMGLPFDIKPPKEVPILSPGGKTPATEQQTNPKQPEVSALKKHEMTPKETQT
jgi:hypothetical protein